MLSGLFFFWGCPDLKIVFNGIPDKPFYEITLLSALCDFFFYIDRG
jgi:hypothetical protein